MGGDERVMRDTAELRCLTRSSRRPPGRVRAAMLFVACGLIVPLLASGGVPVAAASAGSGLDPSYGTGGILRPQLITGPEASTHWAMPEAIAAGPNNTTFVVFAKVSMDDYNIGNPPPEQTYIALLNGSGELTPSWGSGGMAALLGVGSAEQILPLPDGSLLVASRTRAGGRNSNGIQQTSVVLYRLDPTGQIDSRFTVQRFGVGTLDRIHQLVLRPDGRVLVSGFDDNNGLGMAWLKLFDSSGQPVSTFGNAGRVLFGDPNYDAKLSDVEVAGVVVDTQSRTVVAVNDYHNPASPLSYLTRLTAAGARDATYGRSGRVAMPDFIGGIDGFRSGSILATAGHTSRPVTMHLMRVLADGTYDDAFNTRAAQSVGPVDVPSAGVLPGSLIRLSEVVWSCSGGVPCPSKLTRVLPSGALDTSFGMGGRALAPFEVDFSAVDSLGRILDLSVKGQMDVLPYSTQILVSRSSAATPPPQTAARGPGLTAWQARVIGGTAAIRWAGVGAGARYDVRRVNAAWNRSPSAVRVWRSTTKTSAHARLTEGQTACFSVRSHHSDGTVSGWGRWRCVTRAADDRAVRRKSGATVVRGSGYTDGRAVACRRTGCSLTLRGAMPGSPSLVVTKVAGTGGMIVRYNGTAVSRLQRSGRVHRGFVTLPRLTAARTRVEVVTTGGLRIVIDGFTNARSMPLP